MRTGPPLATGLATAAVALTLLVSEGQRWPSAADIYVELSPDGPICSLLDIESCLTGTGIPIDREGSVSGQSDRQQAVNGVEPKNTVSSQQSTRLRIQYGDRFLVGRLLLAPGIPSFHPFEIASPARPGIAYRLCVFARPPPFRIV